MRLCVHRQEVYDELTKCALGDQGGVLKILSLSFAHNVHCSFNHSTFL